MGQKNKKKTHAKNITNLDGVQIKGVVTALGTNKAEQQRLLL
jgi:hypothetical protein